MLLNPLPGLRRVVLPNAFAEPEEAVEPRERPQHCRHALLPQVGVLPPPLPRAEVAQQQPEARVDRRVRVDPLLGAVGQGDLGLGQFNMCIQFLKD